MLTGCYDIATAGFRSDSVVTNTTPTGAYRGAGRPEATALLERAVDHAALERRVYLARRSGHDGGPERLEEIAVHEPGSDRLAASDGLHDLLVEPVTSL